MTPCSLFRNLFIGGGKRNSIGSLITAALYPVIMVSMFCILMSGCTTTGLDPAYQLKSEDAVIVLGIDGLYQASGVDRIGIVPGRSDGSSWRFVAGFSNRSTVIVRDGFVVVRLDQLTDRRRYGVYNIGNFGRELENIATFSAEAGTVTYVGTLAFERHDSTTKSTMLMKRIWNPDAAAKHMQTYYPALASKLRYQEAIDFEENKFGFF